MKASKTVASSTCLRSMMSITGSGHMETDMPEAQHLTAFRSRDASWLVPGWADKPNLPSFRWNTSEKIVVQISYQYRIHLWLTIVGQQPVGFLLDVGQLRVTEAHVLIRRTRSISRIPASALPE